MLRPSALIGATPLPPLQPTTGLESDGAVGAPPPTGDIPPSTTAPSPTPTSERKLPASPYWLLGYRYYKYHMSNTIISYRCVLYKKGCKGAMKSMIDKMGYIVTRPHTCDTDETIYRGYDARAQMLRTVDEMAIDKPALPASTIWRAVYEGFIKMETEFMVQALSEAQVHSRVYQTRSKHYSGDIHGKIERLPLCLVINDSILFFQFHYITANYKNNAVPNRIIGWGHPKLISLLHLRASSIFIDGTFRSAPRGYKQCIILMVHDTTTDLYVPVFYVLTTARTKDAYWDTIRCIFQARDQRLDPRHVVCDFEQALMDAVQTQFPEAIVIGCLFHFKQAVSRAMARAKISRAHSKIALTRGVLDTLTVMEIDYIEPCGIVWVKREIRRRCGYCVPEKEMARILAVLSPHVDGELVARTNNPLERFNREMNKAFPTARPSMLQFVQTINNLSKTYVDKREGILTKRSPRPERPDIVFPPQPDLDDIGEDSDSDDGYCDTCDSNSDKETERPNDSENERQADDGDDEFEYGEEEDEVDSDAERSNSSRMSVDHSFEYRSDGDQSASSMSVDHSNERECSD